MNYKFGFDDALTWFTLPLFVAAFVVVFWIVREVLPSLNEQDKSAFKRWAQYGGAHRVNINGTLKRAWTEHYRAFPNSRKRPLLAILLIAASLSVLAWPLWYALSRR
jgi:hypothetical protein